jgi:hypothetical protein
MRLGIRFSTGFALITALTAATFVACVARADELKLKDGSKISGTIIGFDDNSFKVKTNYGFAVVQKDQVVSISITPAPKAEDAEKKPEPAAKSDAAEKTSAPAKPAKPEATVAPAAANAAAPPATQPAVSPTAQPAPAPKPAVAKTVAPTAVASAPAASSAPVVAPASATAAPPPPPPPKPVVPEPIRENVDGNTYTNETYGFQMYKPPDWQVIAGARTLLPGTITAMGTGDQTTYLLIGQAPAGKTLSIDEDAADRRLRDIMENFRPLGNEHVTVSGIAAVEHKFRGSVDQHDWSGVVVLVPRGAQLYTIFGMTLADTDLVQIQENVIARAISSLQFTKQ